MLREKFERGNDREKSTTRKSLTIIFAALFGVAVSIGATVGLLKTYQDLHKHEDNP